MSTYLFKECRLQETTTEAAKDFRNVEGCHKLSKEPFVQ